MIQVFLLSLVAQFGNTTYQNGDIGLKIDLPAESTVSGTSKNPPFCMISSSNPMNMWHLRLERGINPNAKTAKELLHVPQLGEHASKISTIENNAMRAGDLEGWLHVFLSNDGQPTPLIMVQFALPTNGDQFILATARFSRTSWDRNSKMILECMQTIRPLDPVALIQGKLAALEHAASVLDAISKESLSALIGFHEWRRIQSKLDGGSTYEDIGYALVQVSAGNREEIEIRDGQEELEKTGLIVTVRSRLVPNIETGVVMDAFGRYWVSWDGEESRWSNRVTKWLEKAKATESETGIRNRPEIGSPKSRLIVLQQDLTSDVIKPPFKALAEDPWLPRALVWILGPFLSSSDHDEQFMWMTYENSGGSSKIVTRVDSLHQNDDESWTVDTKVGEGEVTLWSTFNEDGSLLTQTQKNGAVVTGATHDMLENIWAPRNLW
tara:strand:- start:2582 stop:3895 length:1314 start_codon:yes stop_codon:yes gene_type:complete